MSLSKDLRIYLTATRYLWSQDCVCFKEFYSVPSIHKCKQEISVRSIKGHKFYCSYSTLYLFLYPERDWRLGM